MNRISLQPNVPWNNVLANRSPNIRSWRVWVRPFNVCERVGSCGEEQIDRKTGGGGFHIVSDLVKRGRNGSGGILNGVWLS